MVKELCFPGPKFVASANAVAKSRPVCAESNKRPNERITIRHPCIALKHQKYRESVLQLSKFGQVFPAPKQVLKRGWNATRTLSNGIAISKACLRDALQYRSNKCRSEGRLQRRP